MYMHVSLCTCLCHQAQFLPIILCGFTPVFVHEISSPFQELFLVAHVLSILQSNGPTDSKCKPTLFLLGHLFLLAYLITCLFAPLHSFFLCQHVSFPLLACLACLLSASFVSLLSLLLVCWLSVFLVYCMYTWSASVTSKMQAKRASKEAKQKGQAQKSNDQQIRRFSLSIGSSLSLFLSLSLSQHFLLEPCLQLSRLGLSFPVSFLGHFLQVWQCLSLYFSCNFPGLYPWDVAMFGLSFHYVCFALCMIYIYISTCLKMVV